MKNGTLTSTPPDPSKRIEIESIEIGVSRRSDGDGSSCREEELSIFLTSQKGFGFKEVETGENTLFTSVV